MTDLICLVGTRAIAHEYDRALLSPEDARRLAQSPQLETRLDWRVSRALKQRAALPVVSLSHSAGNAAVLCADAPIAAGVGYGSDETARFRRVGRMGVQRGGTRVFARMRLAA